MCSEARSSTHREVRKVTRGIPATDGAGVRMTRLIGIPELDQIDPFLLLDVFRSDNPDDYIAGFPSHPHRGFETVTYMFAGQMRHKDNADNEGVIRAGGVQWMTAGRGIIHSEMPEQEDGLMWGTQLWVNLPASEKMTEPGYHEYDVEQIPEEATGNGVRVKVIAGETSSGTVGAVTGRATDPLYLDVSLAGGSEYLEEIAESHTAMIFVVSGVLTIADKTLQAGDLGELGSGAMLRAIGSDGDCRFLLIAARAIEEPVARGGPFVMNTDEEIRQAFSDYKSGRF